LKYYQPIDNDFTIKAENNLSAYFTDINSRFTYENNKELVVLTKKLMKSVITQYNNIGDLYSGKCKMLIDKNRELETKNITIAKEAKLKIELSETKFKLKEAEMLCDMMKMEMEMKLLKKDFEIEKMKNSVINANK
jgi:hypothetical protein